MKSNTIRPVVENTVIPSPPKPAPVVHDYRCYVERLAQLKSKELFQNGQANHAAIIFETFFKYASKHVHILCKNLSADVFGLENVLNALETALLRKVPVRILYQETPESSAFLESLQRWQEQKLPIEALPATGTSLGPVSQNFAVMDRRAFRFEPDNSRPMAYACMNGPEEATTLDDVFLRAFATVN